MCYVKYKMFLSLLAGLAVLNVNAQDIFDGCRFPGAPAHSTVTFSNGTVGPGEISEEGTVATYQCERGFELLGPSRRTCHTGQWMPEGIPFCVLNVAAGKAPMQISTESGGVPQRAIDGSTSSFFSADTCTLTRPERVPWWYVNLLEPYMVQLVRLDFGKACCGPNKPATIVVRVGNNRPDLGTNPICNRFTGALEEGQPLFLPCNPPMPGAFVSVHLEVPTPSQLSICEAFVYTDQALPIERCPQFRDQPPGSTATYNGKCYIFYNRQPMKFREALNFCRARGGTLVDESNPALQGFVSWELWRRHRSDTSSQYWIGAVRDQADRNNWKWLGGDDVTVSFWNLPGGDEDCARFDGSKGWLWSDTNCNTNLNYICQHQPKACGRPEQPPNSTMIAETGFTVGSTVQYACDEGHLLVGPVARTCLDTGFYNEFPPVCKRIQCGFPADISHGSYDLLNNSVGYLSNVVYSCDEGYEMAGRAQLTCDIDERWNGPPPRCDPVHCEPLGLLLNGLADSSSNVFGISVTFTCSRGYKLYGSAVLKCLATGLWDHPLPICKEESTTVLPPVTPNKPVRITPTLRQRPTRPRPFSTNVPKTSLAPKPVELGKVEEDKPPRRIVRPVVVPSVQNEKPHDADNDKANNIIVAAHPQDNEITKNVNIRTDQSPNVNVPLSVDGDRSATLGARLNLGAIIALGAFGGFVFLAAIVTTIVILIRRNQSAKHYRHRASPDCNTVASFDSSSSESRNGLNRYYRQAWENLHESAGSKTGLKMAPSSNANHAPLRRKETLDEPYRRSSNEGVRDGSELVVTDVYPKSERKRHHHHHHHHGSGAGSAGQREPYREPQLVANARREHREHRAHSHKPRY